MNSSSDESSDSMCFTPANIQNEAKCNTENLLPPKSKERYELAYKKFLQWKTDRKSKSLSESVFLAYFSDLSKKMKASSLWNTYSMLKSTVSINHNLNIKNYHKLTDLLKRQSDGYNCKKSKVLTSPNVEKFINEAPDSEYLAMKVVLIFGIYGACRCTEITNMMVNDVKTHNNDMVINLPDARTKKDRTFVVRDAAFAVVQKYQALRPVDVKTGRFFLNYRKSRCTKQVLGRHTIAQIPKMIAIYLNLPDPELFTGHCFRRSSATLLADTGADLITLKLHGGWKTDIMAKSYIEQSIANKGNISNQISKCLNLKATKSSEEASTSEEVIVKIEKIEVEMEGVSD